VSRSEVTKWALLTSGCLLGGLITLVGVLAILGYAASQYIASRPEMPNSRDYNFYYGRSHFKRSAEGKVFTSAYLVAGEEGPWLWTSETNGFKVDRASAVENGKQLAEQLGLKGPGKVIHSVYVDDRSWSIFLTTAESRDYLDSDAWIKAPYDDVPVAISMTKDGPRISLRCAEEELRKAFGKPTKIIRTSTVGAPGV
jgi:hypothetical protein